EIDDVLPPRRRVPVEIVVAGGLAEDDARCGKTLRQLAAGPLLGPFDLDVAKMGLALGVDVEIVNAHGSSLIESMIPKSGYRFSEKIMLQQDCDDSGIAGGVASVATTAPRTEGGVEEIGKTMAARFALRG